MSRDNGLKQAQRKVFTLATFEDGWWDIYLGGTLIMMSFYSLLRSLLGPAWNLLLLFGVMGILLAGVYAARKYITLPRTGLVKFGAGQKRTLRRVNAVTIVIVVGSLVLAALLITGAIPEPVWSGAPTWLRDFDVDILFTVIIIGFFSLGAATLGVPRLHPYGWLMGLGNLAATVLEVYHGVKFHYPIAASGSIILVIGVALFARFLHRYSLPTDRPSMGEATG
jgi:hypothetical protein